MAIPTHTGGSSAPFHLIRTVDNLKNAALRPVAVKAMLITTTLASSVLMSGCSSSGQPGLLDKSLEAIGLRKPEVPAELRAASTALPTKVMLRIHAGEQLNVDVQKRPLSVIVKVYKLKASQAFLMAPYKSFGAADSERLAFGTDVLESREIVLTPGQRHEVLETVPPEATHLAVVALFRAPADDRWRFAFATKSAERTGVTLGVHACAMSVAAGMPEGSAPEALRVAGVQCQ